MLQFLKMASDSCIVNARYKYIHDDHKNPIEAIDAHHVLVRTSNSRVFFACLSALLLTSTAFSLSLLKDKSILILLWSLLLSALLVKLFLRKPVEKESIIIMSAFGVQLETQYGRGRKVHRFIPIDKILKPVLNECVTPVTCYWSLSLIVRGEEELTLVFKEIRPPVKMLIPIWKALCAATNSLGNLEQF
ncbi:Phosphatidylinositol N-acetylglucosaminyltransferase subunit H like [Actinidia chinensis var. chinensis]|uniref:Phosphatidylinositol N-acetylglucosaminyltransferase subunit H like n=1 Tax=Actinidia chinensis var. chinensis TaxID=1590841 RepID=A0A2R6Q1V9_ACTCC|nr:Phosphatidylinositol N-acetylglucosaminyltransferase subunit H like [Actinidia chinensis var. chinensis]